MNLNDLLRDRGIDPLHVIVLRHRPHEPELAKVLPLLAAEEPAVFNAYQQTQSPNLERAMQALIGVGHVASFIGTEPGKALFVGLYSIKGSKPLTYDQFWRVPAYVRLKEFGMQGWVNQDDGRNFQLWFGLGLTPVYEEWKGKLIVRWPPPERSWWRRAHKNEMSILAILEESALGSATVEWDDIDLTWAQLRALPPSLKSALSQWRGIYFIFDISDQKGYVGSACGKTNLLGRWLDYATRGHGGNVLLRGRDPRSFRFSILQRLSPDADVAEVVALENSWKSRLHTRAPLGLNDN